MRHLEDDMLSKKSVRKRQMPHDHSHTGNIKKQNSLRLEWQLSNIEAEGTLFSRHKIQLGKNDLKSLSYTIVAAVYHNILYT